MSLSQELARGTIMPIVLAMLADRPMYGYEIVKTVNARSGGVLQFKEGTLYPLLHKMQGERLIKGRWHAAGVSSQAGASRGAEAAASAGGAAKRRKYYALTPKGRRLLETSRAQWSELRGAVDSLLMGA